MRLIHWHIPVLLLVVVLLYSPFVWSPIVFDDLPFFMIDSYGNQPVSNFHFSLTEFRSLPYATLAWSKEWFGLEMLPFRVENMLLHAAVVIALFLFLTRLFEVTNIDCGNALGGRLIAFFAALLFALHPVAVYAVGYLIQRTIVMATLFSLLAMLVYLHGSVRQKQVWLWTSVPFYYLAVLSKEHAIMLPAVLLAITVLLHEDWRVKLRERRFLFIALAAIFVWVVIAKKGLLGSIYEPNAPMMLGDVDSELAYPLSILTQSWLFFKYIGLWLFPNPSWMSVDMRTPFAQSVLSAYLISFLVFLSWGAGALWLLFRRGHLALLGFAMLFPWLMFMTELSAVRMQESFVLYRSYLWAVGFACILPLVIQGVDKGLAKILLLAIALAMVPISMERLSSFSNPVLLWEDAEKLVQGRDDLPFVHRIYYNLGTNWSDLGEQERAIAALRHAIELKPGFAAAYGNLGVAYFKKQEWGHAADAFTRAIDLANMSNGIVSPLKFYYGRGLSLEKLGEIERAKMDYKKGCEAGSRGCEELRRLGE